MRLLVTGANGQLGHDVVLKAKSKGHEVIAVDINLLDITDETAVLSFMKLNKPDVVIHCAAYTAVDRAESDRENAWRVNVEGTKNIALACKSVNGKLVYISTDYVFDGKTSEPHMVEEDKTPINYYGLTKYEGECQVLDLLDKYFILRISWVFGINGKNFVKTMRDLGKKFEELTVVNDQVGSPTYTVDLADLLLEMIITEKYGVYHASNEGSCTWYEFAKKIFQISNMKVDVKPVTSAAYKTDAERPKNSLMDKTSLSEAGFNRLPHWEDALHRFIDELETQGEGQ